MDFIRMHLVFLGGFKHKEENDPTPPKTQKEENIDWKIYDPTPPQTLRLEPMSSWGSRVINFPI